MPKAPKTIHLVTADLSEASFYFTVGAVMGKPTRQGTQVFFEFTHPDLEALTQSWQDGTGQVVASKYADAIKHLRGLAKTIVRTGG